MNSAYADLGITWELAGTDRTVNSDWFNNAGPDGSEQTDMKESLRVGDEATLNVYTVGFTSGANAGLLGYSTFPSSYSGAPTDDGVVFLFSSVPGGSTTNYNEGQVRIQTPLSILTFETNFIRLRFRPSRTRLVTGSVSTTLSRVDAPALVMVLTTPLLRLLLHTSAPPVEIPARALELTPSTTSWITLTTLA